MLRTLKRLARHESGQAMAEFTVIFPWVLIFFTVIMQLGSMWEAYQVVQLASWQAARYAAVHPGELQPNSPCDGTGSSAGCAGGISRMELAAELVTLPISPVAVGRENPVRTSFRCNSGNAATCLCDRGLEMLPNTGALECPTAGTPTYTAEIAALGNTGGNADVHHRYIYAHNMTTVKLIDLTGPGGLGGINACNRASTTFVGGGVEAQHVIPFTGYGGPAEMGLGRALIAVETTYMFDMFIPVANWVIFSTYGVLQTLGATGCETLQVADVTYPDDFNTVDFGVRWGGSETPPYASNDFWGKVRKLDLDLADLEDIVDELANPLMPDTTRRFIPRDVTDELSDYLDRNLQFVFPLRTRTLVNLQSLEDFDSTVLPGLGTADGRDGDATTHAVPY